jgi:hypothetical protein
MTRGSTLLTCQDARREPPDNQAFARGRGMEMRSVAIMVACFVTNVAAIATMAGCTPPTAQAYACPTGVPWVPDDYANGKWVPGHCLGQPAR